MTDRKLIEIGHKRVPLKKIFHKKDFATALAELKEFRTYFAEQEILYKAKVIFEFEYDYCIARSFRPENDKELNERLEQERLAREAKLERARKKAERDKIKAQKAELKAQQDAEVQRLRDLDTIKILSRKLGLSVKEVLEMDLTK